MDIDKHVLPFMPWLTSEQQSDLRTGLPLFLREARSQARQLVGAQTDPYAQSWAAAIEPLIERSPTFAVRMGDLVLRQPIKRYAKDEVGVSVSSVYGRGRMAIMSNALAAYRRNRFAPNLLNAVEPTQRDVREEWSRIENDPARLDQFDYALASLNTPTTVSERQALIHMITRMLGKGSLKLMAVGVGTGQGEARLLHQQEYGFDEADVVTCLARAGRGKQHTDHVLRENYRQYMRLPTMLKRIAMVDAMDIYDPVTRLAAAGALRIKDELLNPEFMWRYNGLTYFMDDQRENGGDVLDFHQVDFANQQEVEQLRDELQGELYDFITLSTILNQEPDPARRNRIISNALSFLNDSEHAAVIVSDFFWRKGRYLVPYQRWRKGDYNVFVIQKQDQAQRPEHVIKALDSRVGCLQPGKGTVLTNNRRRSFEELWREGYVADAT